MSKFLDLEDELDLLGYGNSWDEQVEKLAARKQASDDKRLGLLLEYKAGLSPDAARKENNKKVRRFHARQFENFTEMMGTTCHKCQRKFSQTDSRAQRCTSKQCR